MRSFQRENSGFTLIEVLVAITVLAIGIALGVSLISKALINVRKVEMRARIADHANAVMELTLLDPSIKDPTSFNGDFPEDGTRWVINIEDYTPETTSADAAFSEEVNMRVKLLSYTVEMFPPHSNVVDYRLRTLKLVPKQ